MKISKKQKGGYVAQRDNTRVNDPNVQYRAYTNGQVMVDDVSPGNVGLTFFRQPKMIDFNLQSIPEWIAQGFKLKKGGKLENNS